MVCAFIAPCLAPITQMVCAHLHHTYVTPLHTSFTPRHLQEASNDVVDYKEGSDYVFTAWVLVVTDAMGDFVWNTRYGHCSPPSPHIDPGCSNFLLPAMLNLSNWHA